jgi:hypothetical protein
LTELGQLKSNIEKAGISVNKLDVEVRGLKAILTDTLPMGNSTPVKKDSGNQNLQVNGWLPDKIIKHRALSLLTWVQYQLPGLEISRK